MIRFFKYLTITVVLALTYTLAAAHDEAKLQPFRPYGMSAFKDSLSMQEFRDYLSEIRKTRPTVALVLSGGGAKGVAHIGVLQYLDSLKIPVDVVLGTSMGGLMGGMYALGYSPAQMDSIVKSFDWDMALTDKVPRNYVSFATKKYREKFLLSFPFFYARKDYLEKRNEDIRYAAAENKHDQIHFGAGKGDANALVKENLLGSLPSGFAFGQNVNNIFSSLTVGYQDNIDFKDLPVPFVCVATEMVTAKPKIWFDGKINTALRSTMSIPGVFAPVRVDGMVLVDGGMRDNYPTDLAKKMGADIIIGVDLASGYRDYMSLNNLGDIISQGIDMLGRESYEQNVSIPDVTIKPYLPEFNMMSFDDKSVATIMERGWIAAQDQKEALDSIKALIGPCEKKLHNKKAIDINTEPVRISNVEITGVSHSEARYLMEKIGLNHKKKLGKGAIEDAVATIFGTNAFDYVTYELVGDEEPFELVIHCKKGPVHQFGIGGRFDTEEIVSVLLNFGFNVHNIQGSAVDLTGKVGTNPYAKVHYYYMNPVGPTLNATASLNWTDRNQFKLGAGDYTVAYLKIMQELYVSNLHWKKFDVRAGVRNNFFKLNSIMTDKVTGDYDLGMLKNSYLSAFINAQAETFDNGYFPTKGFSMGLGYEFVFKGLIHHMSPFHAVNFDMKAVALSKGCFTLMPSVHARFLFGEDVALPYMNLMGGAMAGRYLPQQIPFAGINYAVAMQNYMASVGSDFRFRLFKNNYLTFMANYAFAFSDWSDFDDIKNNITGVYGTGLKYSFDSIIGPMEFDVHWSTKRDKLGAYLNIGLYF